MHDAQHRPPVGLMVTCLVDLWRPQVGFATVRLLKSTGQRVAVPLQSCCGQPAYNSGALADARHLAKRLIQALAPHDTVVVPSGSCAGMLRLHYPKLLADEPAWARAARDLAARTFELTEFLHDQRAVPPTGPPPDGSWAYHDGCAGLRELGIRPQPRALLSGVPGLRLVELSDPDACCGFGGTFCVKYPDISVHMADDKLDQARNAGASGIITGELGCMLHLAGRARRMGCALPCCHVAEVLAGCTGAALGRQEDGS